MQKSLKFTKEVMQSRKVWVTQAKSNKSQRSSGLPRQEEQLSVQEQVPSTLAASVQNGGRKWQDPPLYVPLAVKLLQPQWQHEYTARENINTETAILESALFPYQT